MSKLLPSDIILSDGVNELIEHWQLSDSEIYKFYDYYNTKLSIDQSESIDCDDYFRFIPNDRASKITFRSRMYVKLYNWINYCIDHTNKQRNGLFVPLSEPIDTENHSQPRIQQKYNSSGDRAIAVSSGKSPHRKRSSVSDRTNYDAYNDSTMTFTVWLHSIFIWCYMTRVELRQLLFMYYDSKQQGELTLNDMKRMIRHLHGDNQLMCKDTVKSIINYTSQFSTTNITYGIWCDLCIHYPQLDYPLYSIQQLMIDHIFTRGLYSDIDSRTGDMYIPASCGERTATWYIHSTVHYIRYCIAYITGGIFYYSRRMRDGVSQRIERRSKITQLKSLATQHQHGRISLHDQIIYNNSNKRQLNENGRIRGGSLSGRLANDRKNSKSINELRDELDTGLIQLKSDPTIHKELSMAPLSLLSVYDSDTFDSDDMEAVDVDVDENQNESSEDSDEEII